MNCPKCESNNIVKNGSIHNGKQKYKCDRCGRQFVENPSNRSLTKDQTGLIDRLLLERILLAGIFRVIKVSKRTIQTYVNDKFGRIPRKFHVLQKYAGKTVIECDKMRSFVGDRKNKVWIRLTIGVKTRKIVGFNAGNRGGDGVRGLWESLPPVYR